MARQTDINKVIGRILKDHKKIKDYIIALDTLGISAYSPEMKAYIESKLVQKYNRHVAYVTIINKVRSIFGIKPLAF